MIPALMSSRVSALRRRPASDRADTRHNRWTVWTTLVLLLGALQAQSRPARIISLVPAATEMLFAIGAGPRVVAVSSFDREPPEVAQLPRVGALVDPDVERILSLTPDLVVVYGSQRDLVRQLDRASIPQFSYVHGSLADILTTIRALGARTGNAAEADRVASDINRALADIRQRVMGLTRPRAMLVFGREPGALRNLYASGGLGFLHDILDVAGADDVFADIHRESIQATTEIILARAPDVIVEVRASDEAAPNLEAWQALPSIPAVRNHRILPLTGSEMVTAGPRIGQAALRLARAIHPEAFE
jgi:iron complex transport system substrate-binding protein